MKYDAFISHAREDISFARELAEELSSAGLSVFLDEGLLAGGQSFAQALSHAIESARFLLVVLTPAYVRSRWTVQELHIAMEEELRMPPDIIKVIPLLKEDCDVPFLIRDKHALDFRDRGLFDQQVSRLVADLHELTDLKKHKAEGPRGELSGQRPVRLDQTTAAELLTKLSESVEAFTSVTKPYSSAASRGSDTTLLRTCFVVMPFGDQDLNIVFEDFIRPVIENECGLACKRGDDLFGSRVVVEDIRSSIASASLILADLTGKNANVFYEVGIAHTIDKPVLLLAQSMDDVPFDLRHRRVLIYEYSPRGCKKLEAILAQHVREMLRTAHA